jgi:hypothetical protein
MNRRNFLKVTLAAGIFASAPVVLTKALERRTPVIYGDGIHDDAEGLQAALDNKPFICSSDRVQIETVGDTLYIRNGYYLIGRTLHINRDNVYIAHCTIVAAEGFRDEKRALHYHGNGCTLSHNFFYNTSAVDYS